MAEALQVSETAFLFSVFGQLLSLRDIHADFL